MAQELYKRVARFRAPLSVAVAEKSGRGLPPVVGCYAVLCCGKGGPVCQGARFSLPGRLCH
eukprot:11222214-Lingulodinium_polyedra.AAC.1